MLVKSTEIPPAPYKPGIGPYIVVNPAVGRWRQENQNSRPSSATQQVPGQPGLRTKQKVCLFVCFNEKLNNENVFKKSSLPNCSVSLKKI